MKKRKQGRKFGRTRAKRRALLFGIAESLFLHGKIRTTEARAREARRIAERAITTGKPGTVAARRQLARFFSPATVRMVVADIAPKYATRPGGYTRLVKLVRRRGDGAPMAMLELIEK